MGDGERPPPRRRSSSVFQSISVGKTRNTDGIDNRIPPPEAGSSHSDMEMEGGMLSDDEGADDDEETGLTHTERMKRDRRRRRSTRLNQRVAMSERDTQTEEQLTHAAMVREMVVNAMLIGLWYTFSISISVYNKWMFSADNLDFHFPLFTTSLHMLVQFSLASLALFLIPSFRPGHSDTSSYSQLDGAQSSQAAKKPLMSWWFYLTRIGPCGTATALDIGLGNFSLRFISLTFFTMCKSSVLGFVLVFAFIFRLEQPTWRLCLVILFMTAGVIMMVAGETAFRVEGFILVMTASFCSGFRWSLTQILLLRNPATSNPFSSIFFLTPVMFLALFVLAVPIEGPSAVIEGTHVLVAAKGVLGSIAILLFPGFLAFFMVAAEFALLKRTSVVTLSVCGIFKEVLTISAAGIIFNDQLSPINISGLVVTIASIAAYNYIKYTNMKRDVRKDSRDVLDEGSIDDEYSQDGSFDLENDDSGHRSTSALMRDSLSLATDFTGHVGKNGVSNSPDKRPEDLD